jgi:hypothetical protein
MSVTHEDRKRDQKDQIDVEELIIWQVLTDSIQHCCTSKLYKSVEFYELEVNEWSCQSTSTFFEQCNYSWNILYLTCERSSNRSFSLR